ncbi:hypothetical protein ACQ4PT_003414 [Festuca glaucescens]
MDQIEQVKLSGQVLRHWLRRRVKSTGTLSLMPRISALMAVQRQTEASRLASPDSSGQHSSFSGTGRLSLSRFSTLAHTFSFRVSIEQVDGVGTTGGGGGGGVGVGQYGAQACAAAAWRARFRARKRTSLEGAIAQIDQ